MIEVLGDDLLFILDSSLLFPCDSAQLESFVENYILAWHFSPCRGGGIDFLIRVREPIIAGAMLFLAFTPTTTGTVITISPQIRTYEFLLKEVGSTDAIFHSCKS